MRPGTPRWRREAAIFEDLAANPVAAPETGTISSAGAMSEIGKPANFSTIGTYVSQDAEDQTAIEQCRAGDPSAFEPIVRRYERLLYTVALRMLGDREDASDAAQNAFVKAYERLGTFDASRRFFSWIYRILVNECIDLRRDRRVYVDVSDQLPASGTPADIFEHRETRQRV